MHFEIAPRQVSVMLYDEDPVNYAASCQVFIYGDRGFMYSITGNRGFYRLWQNPVATKDLFKQLNVRTLEGYVSIAHARLMRAILKNFCLVRFVHEGIMADRPLFWVEVSLLEGQS